MKCLIALLLFYTGILFSQQLPLYAPGQAIVIFNQTTFMQIENELLQESER